MIREMPCSYRHILYSCMSNMNLIIYVFLYVERSIPLGVGGAYIQLPCTLERRNVIRIYYA